VTGYRECSCHPLPSLNEKTPGSSAGGGTPRTSGGNDGDRSSDRSPADLPAGYLPLTRRFRPEPQPTRRSVAQLNPTHLLAAGPTGSLRQKARRLGVSHEAVRQAMIAAGLPTDLESRNARMREMAVRGVPWPAITQAFGLSPSGVRFVCRDLPPRPAGPKARRGAPKGPLGTG
jgi:hypothetical protein